MLILEKPRMKHYKAIERADADFTSVGEDPYCGLRGRVGYIAWLALVDRQSREEMLDYGENPNEIFFLVDDRDGSIKAFGQLRPYDTEENLTWAGHIGYSVPPSQRGNGYAKELLRQLLEMGFSRGMKRILLTCDVDNDASRHIIEQAGGAFAGYFRDEDYHKRLYWFYASERG